MKSPYISPLTPAQRYAAYTAGQNDAPVSLNREKSGAAYGPVRSEEAGLVACFLGGRQKSQPGGHEVPGYFTFHDWHHASVLSAPSSLANWALLFAPPCVRVPSRERMPSPTEAEYAP